MRVETKAGARKFALAYNANVGILATWNAGTSTWQKLWRMAPDALNPGGWSIDVAPAGHVLAAAQPAIWTRLIAWAVAQADGFKAAETALPPGDDGAPSAGAADLP